MTWVTLESDNAVFTYLIEELGVKGAQVEELLSLDENELQSLSPYGLIFLFKYTGASYEATPRQQVDANAAERLFFAKQTVQNACATQAILSIILNQPELDVGPELREFQEFTRHLPPDLRGDSLGASEHIRKVHNSFARANPFVSDEERAATDDDDVFHYIAYLPIDGVLYEMDGLQPGPIAHGKCDPGEFAHKVIPVLQERISRYPANEIRFNLMAIVRDQRLALAENDSLSEDERAALLAQEEAKRQRWAREVAMRRHNFVGAIAYLARALIAKKSQDGELEAFLARLNSREHA